MAKDETTKAPEEAPEMAAKPEAAPESEEPTEQPDTPSGKALAAVGKDGDGEAYAAEKRKHRWG